MNSKTEDVPKCERHEVNCPTVGKLNVLVQGTRASNEVVIFTVHDLGCNHTMYLDYVAHPQMQPIRDRTVWVHVDVPGQSPEAPDLPAGYQFPTMQQLGEDLIHVLDDLKIKNVVCLGEGAGANILARFAIAHINRVMGVCLIHCTGTTAGFMESIKDKLITWKLEQVGMNPTAEAYLVLHRYGSSGSEGGFGRRFSKSGMEDKDQLKSSIQNYQSNLRTRTNTKNLKRFVDAFLKRSNIGDTIRKMNCPVLFVTGSRSVFNGTTRALHQTLVKQTDDKAKVEFLEVAGVANVLEEKPEKMVECFQYFLQGLGLVASVRMQHITRPPPFRLRSMSMEEYDMPKLSMRNRSMSGESGSGSPMENSPPTGGGALSAN